MFVTRKQLVLLGAATLLATGSGARADQFFTLTAVGSGGTTVVESGPNILNLTDDLINESSKFSSLIGQNVNTSLTWGGVPNAVVLTENAAGTSASITFPSTGFSKTFNDTDPSALQSDIHNFLLQDGEQAYAQFLEKMNQESAVAPVDGNPLASTAIIADAVFSRFGITNQEPTVYESESGGVFMGLSGDGGIMRAEGLDGNWADANLDLGVRFGSNVALSFGTTVDYVNYVNTGAYTLAEEVALPITIINSQGNGFSWQIAPWGFGGISASYDEVDGGLLVGGGATSSLAWHMSGLTCTLADQLSYNGSVDVAVDNYQFNTDVDQWIVKNGIDVMYQVPSTPLFVEGGIIYTNFTNRAAIPDYWSPIGGVGLAWGSSSLHVDFEGDYARGFNDTGGFVILALAF